MESAGKEDTATEGCNGNAQRLEEWHIKGAFQLHAP